MKTKLFVCMMTFALIFAGCGSQNGAGAQSAASSAESPGNSAAAESAAASAAAESPAAAVSAAETPAAGESVPSEGSSDSNESSQGIPGAPEITPDAIPVSPESFSALGPDAFITLSKYKEVTQIYPDDAVITEGVIANINFSGVIEGETEPRDGMVGEGYDLKIGSNTFIPGFEENLIGATRGETLVFDCLFPEDYTNPDLAGKNTTWTVLVNLIKTDSDEIFNSIVAESIITSYPQDIYNAVEAIGAFEGEDLKKAYTRRWLTAKAILYKENITPEDPAYQAIEDMILLSMGGYESEEAAVSAGYSSDLIHYYVEYYMACQVIEDNFAS